MNRIQAKKQTARRSAYREKNWSLDRVLDELNSKRLAEGGPLDNEKDSGDETNYNAVSIP